MTDRLVLVTGAGASTNLSDQEDRPLPLMADWAQRLREDLGPTAEALGLSTETDGVDFEETLGAFFRWLEVIPLGARFRKFSSQTAGLDDGLWAQWDAHLARITQHGEKLTQTLHRSLFREFGPRRVNEDAASDAYARLLRALGFADDGRLTGPVVCATTNYDRSLEMAMAQFGTVRTGFSAPAYRTPELDAENLGHFEAAEPSVLYLHGAVGWHRQDDGSIVSLPADRDYNPSLGAPAVLYPGPDKTMERTETAQLWNEFETALQDATHVFVLGHGLNDDHLVSALRATKARLAVTYLSPDSPTSTGAEQVEQYEQDIVQKLPRAMPVACIFGEPVQLDRAAVQVWRQPND